MRVACRRLATPGAVLFAFAGILPAGAAFAAPAPGAPANAGASSEVDALVAEALANNPELAAAHGEAKAAAARAPAAGVLADPMFSVTYENDGSAISLGTEPMTRLEFMVQQAFPFPGTLGAASKVADADAALAGYRHQRFARTLEGAVRRAWADLLEARENQRLVDEQIETWKGIEETIRARYASGMGTQQDVLRAQVERTRLLQQRRRDEAAEEGTLVEMRRLLGRPAGSALPTERRLVPGAPLVVPDEPAAISGTVDAAPEIREAAALEERSHLAADLARRGTRPDFVASAGYSYRGSLPLMWSAGVGVSLPIFAGRRSKPLVAEADARAESAATTGVALRAIVEARAAERLVRMRQLAAEAKLDAEGVLVQDRLAVEAALTSYRTGAVPFVTVLEALGTYFADRRSAVGRLSAFLRAEADLREAALTRDAGDGK
jgi:outer membrane protein TolC